VRGWVGAWWRVLLILGLEFGMAEEEVDSFCRIFFAREATKGLPAACFASG